MKLKPLAPLLCLFIAVSDLSVAAERTVYGLDEYACINDPGAQLAVKLDTGAEAASPSARDIKRFKCDGRTWMRFYLATDSIDDIPVEKPLTRISKIKRHHGDFNPDEGKAYTARPVIKLQVCMDKTVRIVEVNLTDRSAFQYPFLVGSEVPKKFDVLVDPGLKHSAGKPGCKPDVRPAE